MSTSTTSQRKTFWERPKLKTVIHFAALTVMLVTIIIGTKHVTDEAAIGTANLVKAIDIHQAAQAGTLSRADAREAFAKLFTQPGGGMAVLLSLKGLEQDGDIQARDKLLMKYLSVLPDLERRFLTDSFGVAGAFVPSFETTLSEADKTFAMTCLDATPSITDNIVGVANYIYVSLFKTHAVECMQNKIGS